MSPLRRRAATLQREGASRHSLTPAVVAPRRVKGLRLEVFITVVDHPSFPLQELTAAPWAGVALSTRLPRARRAERGG